LVCSAPLLPSSDDSLLISFREAAFNPLAVQFALGRVHKLDQTLADTFHRHDYSNWFRGEPQTQARLMAFNSRTLVETIKREQFAFIENVNLELLRPTSGEAKAEQGRGKR
jgi:hypothetical protein